MFSTWGRVLERSFHHLLDLISVRLCYGCKKAYASPTNKYYCNYCFTNLKSNWLNKNYSRKHLDFSYAELTEFYDDSIPLYPKIYFATEYGPLTKSLMRYFKYHKAYIYEFWAKLLVDYWKLHAGWILSDLSADEAEKFNPNKESNTQLKFWITYVPMHETKLKTRTYNQAALIAKEFTQLLNNSLKKSKPHYLYQSSEGLAYTPVSQYQFLPNLISRIKNTESLYDKSKQERLAILRGAFSVNALEGGSIGIGSEDILIVIDDISTTGATAMEIYRSLNLDEHLWKEIIFLTVTGRNFK